METGNKLFTKTTVKGTAKWVSSFMNLPPYLSAKQIKEILKPAAVEKLQELPFEQILWENFERLCLELAKLEADVELARPYGVKGNEQGGIDIFARDNAKKHIVYQCKNEKGFSPAKIREAVKKYLDGDWQAKSSKFVLCTRESLQKKDRSDAIKEQDELLNKKDIKFVVWDSVELNSLLKRQPQLVYDFFGIHWFIGFCGWDQLHLIKLDYPIPDKIKYPVLMDYLNRTVTISNEDSFAAYFQAEKSLFEILKNTRKIALLAWGLNGKTIELENLASILSEKKEFHPHLIRFSNYADETIESLVKDIDHKPEDSLVILFDGLDEALPDEFEKVCRRIDKFSEAYPLAQIVVSCRTNYYTTFSDDQLADTLNGFTPVILNPWGYEEILRNVRKIHGDNADAFMEAVNQKQLYELLRLPYYMLKLSKQFIDLSTIPNSKAEIFEEETKQLIRKDISRLYKKDNDLWETKLYDLLAKVAFVMEASGTNFINNTDLAAVIPDNKERKLVTDAAAIIYGTESSPKTWRFYHHNTQEYLAAVVLAKKPFSFIKEKVIAIAPGFEKAKPSWFDGILFLYSILPVGDRLKNDIVNWVTEHNKELAIKLEPDQLDDALRFKVFKAIFDQYKKENRWINTQLYKHKDLANFSACPVTFDYLLAQLLIKDETINSGNAMEIMSEIDIQKFADYYDRFKEAFVDCLEEGFSDLQAPALIGLTEHYPLTYEELKPVYDKFCNSKNDGIRSQVFKAIHRLGLVENFTEEIITHLKLLITAERNKFQQRDFSSHPGSENSEVAKCIQNFKSLLSLNLLIDGLGNDFLTFAQLRNFEDTLPIIFNNIEQFLQDEELIRKIMDMFKANSSYILNNLKASVAFLNFFRSSGLLDQIAAEVSDELAPHNASAISAISFIATRNTIDQLFEKKKAGKLSADLISSLNHFFKLNHHPDLDYFIDLFEIKTAESKPAKEFAVIEAERQGRDLAALFDKEKFKTEVNLLFDGFGKDDISYRDLDYSNPDYWSDKYCSIVRDILEIRPDSIPLNRLNVLENIEANWDKNYFFRIYNFLAKNNNASLSEAQKNILINYCNLKAPSISFKDGIMQRGDQEWTLDEPTAMFSLFIRKLGLTGYQKQMYLDMLSFLKHNDGQDDIITFVHTVPGIGDATIKTTILRNLQEGVRNAMLFRNYLDYLKEKKVTEAAPLLISYLKEDFVVEKITLIRLYMELGGNLSGLQDTLINANDKEEHKSFLIDQFILSGGTFIKTYLKNAFKKEKDNERKLFLAGYLTRLLVPQGIKFYLAGLAKTGAVPKNTGEDNPLYTLTRTKYVNDILEVIAAAREVPINHYPGQNLRSVGFRALQNIALLKNQYRIVNWKVKWWIFKKRSIAKFNKRKMVDSKTIAAIRFFWESVSKQESFISSKNLKIEEALAIYNDIMTLNPGN